MKHGLRLSIITLLYLIILTTCNDISNKGYFIKYVDNEGKSVDISGDVSYTYVNGVYINNFNGKVVQFQLVDGRDFQEENMVGKKIKMLIYDTDKSTTWNKVDFEPEKTIVCKIKSFEYQKQSLMDDKEFKLTADFDNKAIGKGSVGLKVNI
ncbi:MAG: hypothetical protein Kow0068_24350 [Marinilabiliales bacterium]